MASEVLRLEFAYHNVALANPAHISWLSTVPNAPIFAPGIQRWGALLSGLMGGPFNAIHVRRGDKLSTRRKTKSHWVGLLETTLNSTTLRSQVGRAM